MFPRIAIGTPTSLYKSTRRQSPEDERWHQHSRDDIKSHLFNGVAHQYPSELLMVCGTEQKCMSPTFLSIAHGNTLAALSTPGHGGLR